VTKPLQGGRKRPTPRMVLLGKKISLVAISREEASRGRAIRRKGAPQVNLLGLSDLRRVDDILLDKGESEP